MTRNIEFRNVRNDCQDKLKEGINEILSSKNLFDFADKSTNLYKHPNGQRKKIIRSLMGSSDGTEICEFFGI